MSPRRRVYISARNKKYKCWCSGYHFPHRKGGGACELSPTRDYHIAIRSGISRSEAMWYLTEDQLDKYFPTLN